MSSPISGHVVSARSPGAMAAGRMLAHDHLSRAVHDQPESERYVAVPGPSRVTRTWLPGEPPALRADANRCPVEHSAALPRAALRATAGPPVVTNGRGRRIIPSPASSATPTASKNRTSL
jgi:hypothetical protein